MWFPISGERRVHVVPCAQTGGGVKGQSDLGFSWGCGKLPGVGTAQRPGGGPRREHAPPSRSSQPPSSSPCFTFDLGPSSTVSGAHWLQPKDAAASLSRGGPGGSSHVGDPNRREPALSLPLPYDALPVAGNCSSLCVPAASTRSPATARGTVCRCVSFLPADRPLLAGATRTFPRSAQWSSRHVDLLSHTECMNE